jgi:hypothetical protein
MTRDIDWNKRQFYNLGPQVHVDYTNPSMGNDGETIYGMYMVSKNGDNANVGMSDAGRFKIHSDQSVEIVGGTKNETNSPSVIISTPGGDIAITAMENGDVKISGKNIVFEASGDVSIQANNIFTKANNKCQMEAMICNTKALDGNAVPEKETWISQTLDDPEIYISKDIIKGLTGIFA